MALPVVRANSPADRVLSQLRHGPRTVEELAKALRITGNAVRNQLTKLKAENLVIRIGTRPGISKPSALFAITPEGQIRFSTLYLPVLRQFVDIAESACPGAQLESLMKETGRSLARAYPRPRGPLKRRADAAARLLRSFGGITEVQTRDGMIVIRSLSCPLAALTSGNRAVCNVLEALLADYIAAPVKNCCSPAEEPRCCFEVTA
jgi:predicted ArsR family transcriptional regulator